MNFLFYGFIGILFLSSTIIIFQDFKTRLVSLWVIVVFSLTCILSVLYFRNLLTLLYNFIGALIYMGLIWTILKTYMYLKFKKNTQIMNEYIGLADIFIVLGIGLTFNLVGLIFFFCFGFIFSLLFFLAYTLLANKNKLKTIPLAGLLVLCYIQFILILNLVQHNFLMDCSFIL
jgi:hypothetical protein